MSKIDRVLQLDHQIEIVDVGASNISGGQIPPYSSLIDSGVARLTGFEPNLVEFEKLKESDSCRYLPYAIGDGRTATLFVTRGAGFCSILEPDMATASRIAAFSNRMKVEKIIPLQTHRLDDLVEIARIDLLKIDIQGGECMAFSGGQQKLKHAMVIITEVSFMPIYLEQPNFADQDRVLQSMGFQFFGMQTINKFPFSSMPRELRRPVRARDIGPCIDGDAVYVRRIDQWDNLSSTEIKRMMVLLDGVCRSLSAIHYLASILVSRGELVASVLDEILHVVAKPQ